MAIKINFETYCNRLDSEIISEAKPPFFTNFVKTKSSDLIHKAFSKKSGDDIGEVTASHEKFMKLCKKISVKKIGAKDQNNERLHAWHALVIYNALILGTTPLTSADELEGPTDYPYLSLIHI